LDVMVTRILACFYCADPEGRRLLARAGF